MLVLVGKGSPRESGAEILRQWFGTARQGGWLHDVHSVYPPILPVVSMSSLQFLSFPILSRDLWRPCKFWAVELWLGASPGNEAAVRMRMWQVKGSSLHGGWYPSQEMIHKWPQIATGTLDGRSYNVKQLCMPFCNIWYHCRCLVRDCAPQDCHSAIQRGPPQCSCHRHCRNGAPMACVDAAVGCCFNMARFWREEKTDSLIILEALQQKTNFWAKTSWTWWLCLINWIHTIDTVIL